MANVSLVFPASARSGDMVQMLEDLRRVEALPHDKLLASVFDRPFDFKRYQDWLVAEIAASYSIPFEMLGGEHHVPLR